MRCGVPLSRSRPSSTLQRLGQRRSVAIQPCRSARRRAGGVLLPGVVGRQVELAGAAGDADAAADAHQPVVAGQRLAGLALQLVEAVEGVVDAPDDGVQRGLGDAGWPR
jgi:hypothetical protein